MKFFIIISLIPIYSFACPQAFKDFNLGRRKFFIRKELRQYKYEPQSPYLSNFIRDLSPSEVMDNLSFLFPEAVKFLTVVQLAPTKYFERKSEFFVSPQTIRKLKKSGKSFEVYGPLPHLPVEFIPYLHPEVIKPLRYSIRYLSDKVQYMTKEQIQNLSLIQISTLKKSLIHTGKNSELSRKQIIDLLKTKLVLFRSIKHIAHDSILVDMVLKHISNRKFTFINIPIDVVNTIPTNKFSLEFLQALKKRSYGHFNNISLQKIYDMDFDLQQYIVTEKWNVFLETPQAELRFRDLSVEKFKQMSAIDKQVVLERMNLSEELFLNILDKS